MHNVHRLHISSPPRWQHSHVGQPRAHKGPSLRSRKPCPRARMQAQPSTASADAKAARRKEKELGREVYKPQSFKELLEDAVEAIDHAIEDGVNRMEVDFPTLAGDSEPPAARPCSHSRVFAFASLRASNECLQYESKIQQLVELLFAERGLTSCKWHGMSW